MVLVNLVDLTGLTGCHSGTMKAWAGGANVTLKIGVPEVRVTASLTPRQRPTVNPGIASHYYRKTYRFQIRFGTANATPGSTDGL